MTADPPPTARVGGLPETVLPATGVPPAPIAEAPAAPATGPDRRTRPGRAAHRGCGTDSAAAGTRARRRAVDEEVLA